MTSNEKKVLVKFKEIKQANTVTIAGTLRGTIGYAYDACKNLCEKGYIERLSPGRFALYRITPLGEEQVGTEGSPQPVSGAEDYECSTCGASIKEDDEKCPKCGIIFEEGTEEKEPDQPLKSSQDKPGEEVLSPATQKSGSREGDLKHSCAPEEWTACNWKWKSGGK